nr:ABC transporter ATP-binding protein [Rubrobacter calidifluminis]
MSGFEVSVEGLSKVYEVGGGVRLVALDNVSLFAGSGEALALMGPSGSGKSTLLHLIGAMDEASAGSIRVGEVEVTGLSRSKQPAYRRTVGFVFQRFHLLPALTVLDNVIAPVLPYRTPFDKKEEATKLLEAVGLYEKASTMPARLSGGQQQRVAIARALINDPGLLLADEPTGNLDTATGKEIMDLILRLRTERGMTVIVATHDPAVAARCDRIVSLRDGRVVSDDAAAGRRPGAGREDLEPGKDRKED